MSYFRRPMGDPITDPSQVDDSIIVGEVPPTRVNCSQLPADSPFRAPGQVCANAPLPGNDLWDAIKGVIGGSASSSASSPASGDSGTTLLMLGGAGIAAYYLMRKKKR